MRPAELALYALALLAAGVMGFAIQRGGTCTVAAVQELVEQRRARRLAAMAEAALWVAAGLLVAQWLGRLPRMPAAYAVGARTVAGGALLGLGAWVNGACVFGAVARFGSGQWAYLATPIGYYLGCLAARGLAVPAPLAAASPLLAAPAAFGLPFAAFAAWRLAGFARGACDPAGSGRRTARRR